ncbi:hypothetical protein DIPPA_17159 [Diplonema papillatum]|nr:hypothetical protein DIPPA_17159 [Diplonema papillatum]
MSAQATYDVLIKCVIIGDQSTGKSCILHRFIEGNFIEDQTSTIGVEFGTKIVNVMDKDVKLQIWDTAGQERYRSVTRSYYRGAAAALIVFDLTSRASFMNVQMWLEDARLLAGQDIVVMLVGNKSDLSLGDQRQVTTQEASLLASHNGMLYFETSAVTGEHIDEAFLKIAKTVITRRADFAPPTANHTVNLREGKSSSEKGCAC